MEIWRILVMGVIKQGHGCDFDYLHELVNEHGTLNRFLGHGDHWDDYRYTSLRLLDNVSLLRPELLVAVKDLVAGSSHAVAERSLVRPWAGAVTDSLSRPTCTIRRMSVFCGT